ncbi:DUF6098 family protein [Georgenia alba]|uniref:DUF6098 family protein n=1 Tax=Georgenia alba TaxID=2233858 RepID=A0ABW2Q6J6_9MICO
MPDTRPAGTPGTPHVPHGDGASGLPALESVGEIVRMLQTTGELFLRVGSEPIDPAGPRDLESGYRLPGAPAYRLVPEPWWLDSTPTWVARQLTSHSYLRRETGTGWLIAGEIAGRTADGVPLIGAAHPLAILSRPCFLDAERLYAAWRCRGM